MLRIRGASPSVSASTGVGRDCVGIAGDCPEAARSVAYMDVEVANHEEEDPAKLGAEPERKRRRIGCYAPLPRWKTPSEQQSYSTKLLEALRHVRRASSSDVPPRSHAVREAADRALAIAARGRTRWSRALLSSCRALRLRKRRRSAVPPQRKVPSPVPSTSAARKTPALERKFKVLGRLVPGCRKLSFPSLLDEASDYIAALQMQVKAMTALSEILSSLGGGPATEHHGSGVSVSATTTTSIPSPESYS